MLSEMWTLQPPFFLTKKLFNIGVYEEEVRLKKILQTGHGKILWIQHIALKKQGVPRILLYAPV